MSRGESEDLKGTVAIVSMVGRFPGARNLGEFWRNLRGGIESVRFITSGSSLICWKRMFGRVISGDGKPGISTRACSRPSGMFSMTPKSSALPTQAATQAGFRLTSRRSTHMLHFETWPFTGSSCGALYGQTQVQ